MPTTRFLTALAALAGLCACATLGPRPAPLQPNLKMELLREAASQPNATPITVLAAYSAFASSGRSYEGYEFFRQRAAAEPKQPLYLAAAGVCQANLAGQIGFFSRLGWVNDAVDKLDRAVAADPLYSRYLRALVLAELPEGYFHKAAAAVEDLTWALEQKEFPYGFSRNLYRGLARAYASLGRPADAAAALESSGYPSENAQQFATDFWLTSASGFHYGKPQLVERAPGLYVAEGFDFSDFAFVVTRDSVVAIDAGFNSANVKLALEALRKITPLPISHVIFTHAHYDHVGGLGALAPSGAEVIASARFSETLETENARAIPYPFFQTSSPRDESGRWRACAPRPSSPTRSVLHLFGVGRRRAAAAALTAKLP